MVNQNILINWGNLRYGDRNNSPTVEIHLEDKVGTTKQRRELKSEALARRLLRDQTQKIVVLYPNNQLSYAQCKHI